MCVSSVVLQASNVLGREKIEEAYNRLVAAVGLLTNEIQARQEQEKVEEEERQKMRKLRDMQV